MLLHVALLAAVGYTPINDAATGLSVDLGWKDSTVCWFFPADEAKRAPCADEATTASVLAGVKKEGRLIALARFEVTGGVIIATVMALPLEGAGRSSIGRLQEFARGYHQSLGKVTQMVAFKPESLHRVETAGTTTVQFALPSFKPKEGVPTDHLVYVLGKRDELLMIAFEANQALFSQVTAEDTSLRNRIRMPGGSPDFGIDADSSFEMGQRAGRLTGYACCGAMPFVALGLVLWLVFRKKPPAPSPPQG